MTNQGLECRTAVLSGNQAEAVKSPQHQAKIMRHPAWHHPRRLTLEGLKVIAAEMNIKMNIVPATPVWAVVRFAISTTSSPASSSANGLSAGI